MSTYGVGTLITEEQDKLDFESLPEFVREPKPAREQYSSRVAASQPKSGTAAAIAGGAVAAAGTAAAVAGTAAVAAGTAAAAVASKIVAAAKPAPPPPVRLPAEPLPTAAKAAELEALWPGVSHEVFHSIPRRSGGSYFGSGFVTGVVVTIIVGCAIQFASHLVPSGQGGKEIIVAQSKQAGKTPDAASKPSEPGAIIPLVAVYTVVSGDTLAGIALKNYHRATPRLLDEICKANNMANANVLNLGQKLSLPDYHPQSRQIATGVNQIQQ